MMEASESFSRVSDDYQKYRPGYPEALYDRIISLSPPRSDSCLLDVGCGTGNVAKAFTNSYPLICGVDPSFEMLRHGANQSQSVYWLRGVAERLPLRPNTVDCITVGQAFHWFEPQAFLEETKRALKPGSLMLQRLSDFPMSF